ncbi:MAG: pilus assembly FimT family protein, partial [Verrucomicrobiales bacterium]
MNVRSKLPSKGRGCQAGYSLVEMIVTVTVIGVMLGVAIKTFSSVNERSRDIIANEVKEAVNLGVKKFSQGSYKIETAADPDATTDESVVLTLLQTRDDTIPGTPFVDPKWAPIASSSSADHRIEWVGEIFVLLKPGVEG